MSTQKLYTFETTYILKALNEPQARKVVKLIELILELTENKVDCWTKILDIEDEYL